MHDAADTAISILKLVNHRFGFLDDTEAKELAVYYRELTAQLGGIPDKERVALELLEFSSAPTIAYTPD